MGFKMYKFLVAACVAVAVSAEADPGYVAVAAPALLNSYPNWPGVSTPTANPHAMDAMEREVLMLMPMPFTDTTDMLHMLTVLPHTDTDMVSELPDTQLVPPSLPDPHRDLARDPLMPSTDTELSQSQPPPTDTDPPATESPRDTPDMPALSSKSLDCTKPIIYYFF